MTMDRTLKGSGGLLRIRSVLTRAERLAKMTEEGKFDAKEGNPLGLPKLKVRHSKAGGKAKKEEAAAETGEAAPAAGAAAPAAKGAAPAAKAAAAPAKGAAKGEAKKK